MPSSYRSWVVRTFPGHFPGWTSYNQSLKKILILRGAIFAQISPFAQHCNFSQILLPWRTIFVQICDLAEHNFSQILQFACNLCAILAHFQHSFPANSANYTKNLVLLRLLYCISLKKPMQKLFVATTKHLRATFRQFFADFSGFFSSICAQIGRNFSVFSAQFSRKFCIFSPRFSSGTV